MNTVAVIPARMGSTRFPGKPLAPILGRPMIQWVYEGARRCERLREVYIATCDEEIQSAAKVFGAKVIMTSDRHERASDRVAEAARQFNADIVVMVQGDEPMITPDMVDATIDAFEDPKVLCTNLAATIDTEEEFRDPNTVKVVFGRHNDALYFSREPIPTVWKAGFHVGLGHRQVCIIGFRREFLFQYAALEPTPWEQAESIDMLRILEHGFSVRIIETDRSCCAVDTEADRQRVERLIAAVHK
jgi:3-deoxy-manno-octulosonate cytidylyltransferase (CMP-KDO synthetase)